MASLAQIIGPLDGEASAPEPASIAFIASAMRTALERTGHRPKRALQRLCAVLFTSEQAELLQAKTNDVGLLVERRGFLADGRAVEFSQSPCRGDTYDFVAELGDLS